MEEVMHNHQLDVITMILIYLQHNRRGLNQRSVELFTVVCVGYQTKSSILIAWSMYPMFVRVEEQVALFLSILAHHKKIKVVKFDFARSGYTVSYYVHRVLRDVIRLQASLLATPEPVTDESTDNGWKWFPVYACTSQRGSL
ncbi:hypothetical protein SASPL_145325 [Salvia splendens]|uniref:DUF8040 domain-containing protein n=1 Tax=Salvia splendens TaxID=180675 RepID=A0A8X8WHB7_SALSN|nr:hypothetical protein SASPL_145325 [Salvia splendens]